MSTTDRTMIRRTEVQMTRTPKMPCFNLTCPFCGSGSHPTVHGEHDCAKCGAPLELVKPRKTG
jgi:hypothetical protein